MQYTTLGSSGLKISRIALGCMSFGDTSRGFNQWALDDKAAEPLFRQAVKLGITFWDTANAYGYGTSEEAVGRAVHAYTRREDVVLATKVYSPGSCATQSYPPPSSARRNSSTSPTPQPPSTSPSATTRFVLWKSTTPRVSQPATDPATRRD
jgi:aryl-alcohol dehydrogenase-like predicted oxidoreductase